jgi:hypothetical protein
MIHLNARYVFHYYVHSDHRHEGSTPYSLMSFATTTLKTLKTTNDKKDEFTTTITHSVKHVLNNYKYNHICSFTCHVLLECI